METKAKGLSFLEAANIHEHACLSYLPTKSWIFYRQFFKRNH